MTYEKCNRFYEGIDSRIDLDWRSIPNIYFFPNAYWRDMSDYIYHGDRYAKMQSEYASLACNAARKSNGKCIRGKNSNMLVEFNGKKVVVPARMLRKNNNYGR